MALFPVAEHVRTRSLAAWLYLYLCLCSCLAATTVHAAKVDTIVLDNGNLVTGEIKQLEFGKLRYSTDSMGTVMVEWDEIRQISSGLAFTVETRNGARYFGPIPASPIDGTMTVRHNGDAYELPMANVVRIQRIKDSFLDRLETNFSAGYSYSKSSDVTDFNLNLELSYLNEKGGTSLNVSSRISDDGEEEKQYNRALFEHRHFLPRKTYWFGLIGAEQNDELGLDYRLLSGGGIGRKFVQTNWHQLNVDLGLIAVQSESKDGTSDTDLEGIWRTHYRIFDYDTPKTELSTSVILFPGISNAGDYRFNYDLSLRKEIVEDFFWDVSFFYRYESATPDMDASNDDYGITTSIGLEL